MFDLVFAFALALHSIVGCDVCVFVNRLMWRLKIQYMAILPEPSMVWSYGVVR